MAVLQVGSFFGERSILFDQITEYAYIACCSDGDHKNDYAKTFVYSLAKPTLLKICEENRQFGDFLRNRCIKRDSYWKCYEIAKREIDDANFNYSGQKDLK